MHRPIPNISQDDLLLVCTRHMNLDDFWNRKRLDVQHNTQLVLSCIKFLNLLGLEVPFEHNVPYPNRDHYGYEVVRNILLYSRKKGKYTESHNQFETIGKLRIVYGNHYILTPASNIEYSSMVDRKDNYTKITND